MKKKTVAIVGVCMLLAVAAAVAVTVFLLTREKKTDSQTYVIGENDYRQISEEMDAAVKDGYFETYMNTAWTFKDGSSKTEDAVLGNSPNNTKPIRCEVILDETGEMVFSTGVMPVGVELPPFQLGEDLDAGVYEATCMVYLLDEGEDGTYTDSSSAGFHVTITVES